VPGVSPAALPVKQIYNDSRLNQKSDSRGDGDRREKVSPTRSSAKLAFKNTLSARWQICSCHILIVPPLCTTNRPTGDPAKRAPARDVTSRARIRGPQWCPTWSRRRSPVSQNLYGGFWIAIAREADVLLGDDYRCRSVMGVGWPTPLMGPANGQ